MESPNQNIEKEEYNKGHMYNKEEEEEKILKIAHS